MIGQVSEGDIKRIWSTIGMGDCHANPQALWFNFTPNQTSSVPTAVHGTTFGILAFTAGLIGGNGIVNNAPFAINWATS